MSRPLRPCLTPGCAALVARGHCTAHAPPPRPRHSPEADRFYASTRWKNVRAIVRRAQPICQRCKRAPSQSVDHKNSDLNDLRFDPFDPLNSNLEALCQRCHNTKTSTTRRGQNAS